VLSLRRRVGGGKWPTRLGGPLAWETRYKKTEFNRGTKLLSTKRRDLNIRLNIGIHL